MFGYIRKDEAHLLASQAYQNGLLTGYEFGKIAGQAEALNMGYIMDGTRVQKEIDEILRAKEQ